MQFPQNHSNLPAHLPVTDTTNIQTRTGLPISIPSIFPNFTRKFHGQAWKIHKGETDLMYVTNIIVQVISLSDQNGSKIKCDFYVTSKLRFVPPVGSNASGYPFLWIFFKNSFGGTIHAWKIKISPFDCLDKAPFFFEDFAYPDMIREVVAIETRLDSSELNADLC